MKSTVSTFARDNTVYFEFHESYCLVECHVSKQVLLSGVEGADA